MAFYGTSGERHVCEVLEMHSAKSGPNWSYSKGVLTKYGVNGAFVTKVAKTCPLCTLHASCHVSSKLAR